MMYPHSIERKRKKHTTMVAEARTQRNSTPKLDIAVAFLIDNRVYTFQIPYIA